MPASPILLLQWLPPGEYCETRAALAEFAKTVNIQHADVQAKAGARQAIADWFAASPGNTQYPFLGAHGIIDAQGRCIGIGASGKADEYATWPEVWEWLGQGTLSGGLWLGACNSSDAAAALSPVVATATRIVIPYIVGFRDSIYPAEIEAILRQLLKNTDTKRIVFLDDELARLRAAVSKTAVQMFHPAYTLAKTTEYVNVDEFEQKVGVTFRRFLENQR